MNRGGVPCDDLEEPELLTVKNSRCPPCLLHDQQQNNTNTAWERQALEESERLAANHAQQMEQRQADLAREEEEQLQRILQESEQTAQQAPAHRGFIDDEEELRKALEASEETKEKEEQRRASYSGNGDDELRKAIVASIGTSLEDERRRASFGGDDDEELRKAFEASMGTSQEDEQRRVAQVGPRIFFVRHVKKICCGKVVKEQTDIEKDAGSDGIPFLEEDDYMPCDDCVQRILAEQEAVQFGGPSTGADVPPLRTGHLPPGFTLPTSSSFAPVMPSADEVNADLDHAGRGKTPLYPQRPTSAIDGYSFNQTNPTMTTQTVAGTDNPPDSELPQYTSRLDLSPPAMASSRSPSDTAEMSEVTHVDEITQHGAEMSGQSDRLNEINTTLSGQGRPLLSDSTHGPLTFREDEEQVESRPASPRTVMANAEHEDAARQHLATARANLQQMQQQPTQAQSFPTHMPNSIPQDEEEAEDSLSDLPGDRYRTHGSSGAPPSSAFRRGGLHASPQARAGSSSSITPRRTGMEGLPPGAPRGPEDHDWDHDWLNEEGNQAERLPSWASSLDVSRGTRTAPDQENEYMISRSRDL